MQTYLTRMIRVSICLALVVSLLHAWMPAILLCAPSCNDSLAPPSLLKQDPSPKRVLLVDDDEDLRMVSAMFLEMAGYHVSLASNGHEGLEMARHETFDLVISDVNMPKMNGDDMAREVKKIHPELPILLVSGAMNPADPRFQIADGFLRKPFESDRLVAKAAEVMASRRERPDYPTDIPQKIHALLTRALGEGLPGDTPRTTWNEQRSVFGRILERHELALREIGRVDLVRLLDFMATLEPTEGYSDELVFIQKMLTDAGNDVPAIFQESPMEDTEYILLQVEATGYDVGDRITEITAVHYRGTRKIAQFHTLVNPGVPIPRWMAQKVGIDDALVISEPSFGDVADAFLDFLGELPLVMHHAKFHMNRLNEELQRIDKRPVANKVIDTVPLARKAWPALANHALPTIREHLDMSVSQTPRAEAYTRMYLWVLQYIALEYERQGTHEQNALLKEFAESGAITAAKHFAFLKGTFGHRVQQIRSWDEIVPFVKKYGIRRIFLDFDMTAFRSKGYYSSDPHVSRRFTLDDRREFIENQYISHDDFLAKLGFFELMEGDVPEILRKLQAMGVEIIVWTARGTNPGEKEKIIGMFDQVGVTIKDIILSRGRKKEALEAYYHETEQGDSTQRPPTLLIDDSSSHIRKVLTNTSLGHNTYALQASFTKEGFQDLFYKDWLRLANRSLDQGNLEDAIGFYFNAHGIAVEKETPATVAAVRDTIHRQTQPYRGHPFVQELLLRMEEITLEQYLWNLPIPEGDRTHYLALLHQIIPVIPNIDANARVPILIDLPSFYRLSSHEQEATLAVHLGQMQQPSPIVLLGNFDLSLRFYERLLRHDPALSDRVYGVASLFDDVAPETIQASVVASRILPLVPLAQTVGAAYVPVPQGDDLNGTLKKQHLLDLAA